MMRTCAPAATSVTLLALLAARSQSAPQAFSCTCASFWCRSIAQMMRTCASAATSVTLLTLFAARFHSAPQAISCTCASFWCRSIALMMRTCASAAMSVSAEEQVKATNWMTEHSPNRSHTSATLRPRLRLQTLKKKRKKKRLI
jgi:hypothetical protein